MKLRLLFIALFVAAFASAQQAYYNDVNLTLTGIPLRDALATKVINTHTKVLSYTPGVWEADRIVDLDPADPTQSKVLLIYGYNDTDGSVINDRTRDKNNNGGNVGQWNREHTYPQSLGGFTTSPGPGTDVHHVRASDVQFNGQRGNTLYAAGSGNAGPSGGGWYPGDEWKGDVARMMMYMYLRYGNQTPPNVVTIGSANAIDPPMIDLLLQWNAEDPVSQVEDNRNNYLENVNNTYGQGNRNPFIDEPFLATLIWGGTAAEDRWGIFTGTPDTTAPSVPTGLAASNITTSSVVLTWNASTDDVAVTAYEIFRNGVSVGTTGNLTFTVSGLTPATLYSFTVTAKDPANNSSAQSAALQVTTLAGSPDTTPPSVPSGLAASNITSSGLTVSWNPSTDDTSVSGYEVFQDGVSLGFTTFLSMSVVDLLPSTTYTFTVTAFDAANNTSAPSAGLQVTTAAASGGGASELFFSEYVEGSSNNKALEIANFTGTAVDLSVYTIQKQSNGAGGWINPYSFTTPTLADGSALVVANSLSNATILGLADEIRVGAPLDFNGNDPVGLFKNGVLIDVIGTFNNTANFSVNETMRRKPTITSPNTTFDKAGEWNVFPTDTFGDLGTHTITTLSSPDFGQEAFKMYPNPVSGGVVFIQSNQKMDKLTIYGISGQVIKEITTPLTNQPISLNNLSKGVYLAKITFEGNKTVTRKIVIN
jgi:endonuclease I/chitodextrinase